MPVPNALHPNVRHPSDAREAAIQDVTLAVRKFVGRHPSNNRRMAVAMFSRRNLCGPLGKNFAPAIHSGILSGIILPEGGARMYSPRKWPLVLPLVLAALWLVGCGSSKSSSSSGSASGAGQSALAAAAKVTVPGGESGATKFQPPVPGSGSGLKLGYISLSEAVPFAHLVTLGIEHVAKADGAQMVVCDAKNDPATALACARTFVSEGVQGYLNFQADASAAPSICSAGPKVPVIAIDIPQSPCQKAFMGANNSAAGELAGLAVGTYFKQRFQCKYDAYISLNGFESGAVNTARMGGYDKGFSSVCGTIHNERKIQADRIDQARSAFTDVLTALPGASRIIAVSINDDGIEGAIAAAKTQGRVSSLFVSGQGADPSAWCDIKTNSQWIADSAYFPERYGQIGVPNLIKLIKHQTVPPKLFVPHVVINQTNIDHYYHPTSC